MPVAIGQVFAFFRPSWGTLVSTFDGNFCFPSLLKEHCSAVSYVGPKIQLQQKVVDHNESLNASPFADIRTQINVVNDVHYETRALNFCITRGRAIYEKVLRIMMRYVFWNIAVLLGPKAVQIFKSNNSRREQRTHLMRTGCHAHSTAAILALAKAAILYSVISSLK